MHSETVKRKRSACQQDNEEMSPAPERKLRRVLQTWDVNFSRRYVTTPHSLHGSTAREERAEITDGRGCQLELEGHPDDEHRSADVGEQVAEHSLVNNSSDGPRSTDEGEEVAECSSVDNNNDGDSGKCPICSATFTTQDVGTPNTCDHIFCAACLEELSKNENNCPVDKKVFNYILVRHHSGGNIVMVIPVESEKRQGEPLCCEYILGHGWNPVFVVSCLLASMVFHYYGLPPYFSP